MRIEWVGKWQKRELITAVLECAGRMEGLPDNTQASITFVSDDDMKNINNTQRGIDETTDVLSFPTVFYKPHTTAKDNIKRLKREIDPESGHYMLGDIVINTDIVSRQAESFGHSFERELAYLAVHGFLHLLGYDHETEDDRTGMRAVEESVLLKSNLSRDGDISDGLLVDMAFDAMENAHVPYSRYRVGACILADDGRVFSGCNIENASYGLTICAERTAVFKAVSEGVKRFRAIAVAAEGGMPYPCGACRQVLSEFSDTLRVMIACGDDVETYTLEELLPHGFRV